jgi:formylmethanofuran dehydrogenase subunit E
MSVRLSRLHLCLVLRISEGYDAVHPLAIPTCDPEVTVDLKESEQDPQPLSMSRPAPCTHSRLISDSVTEQEHKAGNVRCVECGAIVPDPYLKRDGKET